MGWSCRQDAYKTMKTWSDNCFKQTGSSNVYQIGQQKYFFETSRKEHNDGAITGTIFRFVGQDHARKMGLFRIEGNGEITRGPKFLSHPLV